MPHFASPRGKSPLPARMRLADMPPTHFPHLYRDGRRAIESANNVARQDEMTGLSIPKSTPDFAVLGFQRQ